MLKGDRRDGLERQKSAESLLGQLEAEKNRKKARTKALRDSSKSPPRRSKKSSLSPAGARKEFTLAVGHASMEDNLNASSSSFGSSTGRRKKKDKGMGKYFEKSKKKEYLSYSMH